MVLGERCDYLQIFDIKKFVFTHTHEFKQTGGINDILAIGHAESSQFLLAANLGLLKTTRDHLLSQAFKSMKVTALSHIADSLYLVGLNYSLIVWDEQSD